MSVSSLLLRKKISCSWGECKELGKVQLSFVNIHPAPLSLGNKIGFVGLGSVSGGGKRYICREVAVQSTLQWSGSLAPLIAVMKTADARQCDNLRGRRRPPFDLSPSG